MGLLSKAMFWRKEEPLPAPEMPKEFGSLGLPKEENLGLPAYSEPGTGMPAAGRMPGEESSAMFGTPRLEEAGTGHMQPSFMSSQAPGVRASSAYPASQGYAAPNKDLEIISLKLDALKSTLEAINERLARLEKIAVGGAESERF